MKRILLQLIAFCLLATPLFATHNRAGEITYERISQYNYKVTITTYTKTSSPADRPELDIFWGDGTTNTLARTSYQDNYGGAGSDVRKNIYIGTHTYPGPSIYTIYFEDPNRNGGVVNIPNSINVPFYVESQLIISVSLGFNNSPVLLQPPIDQGAIGQVFIHNPNAYDPDGDSLSYELIFCKGADGLPIPGYAYPNANNSFTLNAVTGDLIWDSPTSCGEFNVAFLIREWRSGFNIGYVERDMQITILCNNPNSNQPPQITALNDLCVTAGTNVSFPVTAIDPNSTNTVTLTATGSPLQLTISPAQFNQPVSGTGTVTQNFDWLTDCAHVRRQPYQVVFKAEDNDPFVNLVDLESVQITVVAPAPQNPTAVPSGNSINVGWDISPCPQALGYKIYRRNGFYGFVPGPCETGVPAYTGYQKIAQVPGINNLTFHDDNNGFGLSPGTDYCYMIIAYFADSAESYASVEVCATLKKDAPVITNVSVTSTDAANGTMYVAWSKPTDLDTIQYPGPYEYKVLRAIGLNGTSFSPAGSTFDLNDTIFNDVGLNTVANAYNYKIELYATVSGAPFLVGSTQTASSVYLSISPTDEKLNLSWQMNVPWQNTSYTVYRQNGAVYDSIGFSNTTSYTDINLINGQLYCYKIKSVGSYSGSGFVDPIENYSQETCERPYDNVPPCALSTDTVSFNCLEGQLELTWNIPDSACADDVKEYHIYYSPSTTGSYTLIATVTNGSVNTYTVNSTGSIAGCYYVTAVDTNGNEGAQGVSLCVDNCPAYELPNIFTPDGNGVNDLFHPFPYRYVKDVHLQIFNRWGLKVFETTDPDVNWNGKTDNTGSDLPDGVYFYIGSVTEIYLTGEQTRQLPAGTIQLLRDKSKFK